MSVTIFGEYFCPMSIGLEILYYVCIVTAAVLVCRNLYLAVRVSMSPEEGQGGASRSGTIRRHLFRAAKACALSGVILYLGCWLYY
mgnify:CR=1 FL=1|jgi:hypothetical protein